VLGAVAAAVLLGLGEVAAWRKVREVERRVVTVAPTRRLASAELVRVPVDLAIPAVPWRVLERLAREYEAPRLATVTPAGAVVDSSGRVLPGGLGGAELVLGEYRIPRLPEGGSVLVTREEGGALEVRVQPRPRPFVGIGSEWAVGGLAGPAPSGGGVDWRGYVRWSGVRVGRVHLVLEAGAHAASGRSGAYALAGAELRF
jgi:hypothetical protein